MKLQLYTHKDDKKSDPFKDRLQSLYAEHIHVKSKAGVPLRESKPLVD